MREEEEIRREGTETVADSKIKESNEKEGQTDRKKKVSEYIEKGRKIVKAARKKRKEGNVELFIEKKLSGGSLGRGEKRRKGGGKSVVR